MVLHYDFGTRPLVTTRDWKWAPFGGRALGVSGPQVPANKKWEFHVNMIFSNRQRKWDCFEKSMLRDLGPEKMQNTVETRNLKKLIPIALFWWVMTKKSERKKSLEHFWVTLRGSKIFKDFSFGTRQNFVGFLHSPLWCSGEAVDHNGAVFDSHLRQKVFAQKNF